MDYPIVPQDAARKSAPKPLYTRADEALKAAKTCGLPLFVVITQNGNDSQEKYLKASILRDAFAKDFGKKNMITLHLKLKKGPAEKSADGKKVKEKDRGKGRRGGKGKVDATPYLVDMKSLGEEGQRILKVVGPNESLVKDEERAGRPTPRYDQFSSYRRVNTVLMDSTGEHRIFAIKPFNTKDKAGFATWLATFVTVMQSKVGAHFELQISPLVQDHVDNPLDHSK